MKKIAFCVAAALAVSVHASAASRLEGTYSGWVKSVSGTDFPPFNVTFTVTDVKGGSAKITNKQGNSGVARVDGNTLTFSSKPGNIAPLVNTLTIKGDGTAEYFVKNTGSGNTFGGTLNRQ